MVENIRSWSSSGDTDLPGHSTTDGYHGHSSWKDRSTETDIALACIFLLVDLVDIDGALYISFVPLVASNPLHAARGIIMIIRVNSTTSEENNLVERWRWRKWGNEWARGNRWWKGVVNDGHGYHNIFMMGIISYYYFRQFCRSQVVLFPTLYLWLRKGQFYI